VAHSAHSLISPQANSRLNAKIRARLTLAVTMFSTELFIVSTLKALVEIAGMALLAQGLVGLFSGKSRQDNFVYRLLQIVTLPVSKGVRKITPKFIADNHIGLASFFLLFWLWVALVAAKAYVCGVQHLACGQN
jgi:hypothetical protein